MENEKIKPGDKFISPHIYDDRISKILMENWSLNNDCDVKDVNLISKPFKVCRIKNILTKPLGTYDFRGEALSVHNKKRGNDLMKLEESVCDLQYVTEKMTYSENIDCIKQFCSELVTDFKPWLSKITGIKFNNQLSIRTSKYTDTDFLLCHNDKIDDRRIAFILYLSKEWTEDCGGQLNLFNCKNGSPTTIEKSLVPEFNSLLFFEVTDYSFHSVSEILKNTNRFSVNGWFHGPLNPHLSTRLSPSITNEELDYNKLINNIDNNILSYINETRLSNSTFIQIINKVIETTSFCGIKSYVKEREYNCLLKEISSNKIKWINVGPPDQKNYEVANISTLPDNLKKFCNMFRTTAFCNLLKGYTDLQLVTNEKNDPKLTIELQRWHQGCYTVLHDKYINNKDSDEEAESEDDDFADMEQNSIPIRKMNGEKRKSMKYTVKDMLNDIIIHHTDISKILPSLPSSINEEVDNLNEPGPSCSSSKDDGLLLPKRRRMESENNEENMDAESVTESEIKGTLDVVMYFHGDNAPANTTLDYVDPGKEDGVFLTLPIEDNSLFVVFREDGVVRHHEYVNHYCKGNFYSLVCSYTE